ncbi:hypothetical protein [Gemmatimonas sp.]|uniref:hypothetical protein n=1 Tax=Gemmatimonas sp. TaxID=1962908 RepID=UPI0037BF5A50
MTAHAEFHAGAGSWHAAGGYAAGGYAAGGLAPIGGDCALGLCTPVSAFAQPRTA